MVRGRSLGSCSDRWACCRQQVRWCLPSRGWVSPQMPPTPNRSSVGWWLDVDVCAEVVERRGGRSVARVDAGDLLDDDRSKRSLRSARPALTTWRLSESPQCAATSKTASDRSTPRPAWSASTAVGSRDRRGFVALDSRPRSGISNQCDIASVFERASITARQVIDIARLPSAVTFRPDSGDPRAASGHDFTRHG